MTRDAVWRIRSQRRGSDGRVVTLEVGKELGNGYTFIHTSRAFANLLSRSGDITPYFLAVLVHIGTKRGVFRNSSRKGRSGVNAGTAISSSLRRSPGCMSEGARRGAVV